MASPDLDIQFSSVKVPTVFPDELGRVGVVVTNQGEKRLQGPLKINLYGSTDSVPNLPASPNPVLGNPSNDELLGTLERQTVNLKPGQSKTFTLDFTTPEFRTASVVSPGAYYLFASVDPGNTVTESNEDNNLATEFVSADGSDVVLDWNATLLNAIQAVATRPISEPPFAARNSAIVHAAIYDAVNAIDRSHSPYFVNIDASDPLIANASPDAAAVEAAYQTLVTLYPTEKDAFDLQRSKSLAEIPDGEFEDNGVALGKFVADQILELRSDDGAAGADNVPYTPGTDPGDWRPTPTRNPLTNEADALLPGWGEVTPFAIPSVEAILPAGVDGPPAIDSAEYAADLEEVRMKGGLKDTAVTKITRTEDETEIAKFWSYDRKDSFRPQGQWNELTQEVALEQGNTLAENARLFARLNIAEADALIAAWDLKYTYEQWRPITAINQAAGTPFNPGVVGDPNWEPLLDTPPFPDYISGHATLGAAAAAVLTDSFGENYSFDIPSQDLGGVARSYNSFMEAAEENALSRLYGGVHVRSSSEDGLAVGSSVGNYVVQNILV